MTITKTPRRYSTEVAAIRCWRVKHAPYELVEIRSLYGLPRRYLVIERLPNGNERVVSQHRRRQAAERVLRRKGVANV